MFRRKIHRSQPKPMHGKNIIKNGHLYLKSDYGITIAIFPITESFSLKKLCKLHLEGSSDFLTESEAPISRGNRAPMESEIDRPRSRKN